MNRLIKPSQSAKLGTTARNWNSWISVVTILAIYFTPVRPGGRQSRYFEAVGCKSLGRNIKGVESGDRMHAGCARGKSVPASARVVHGDHGPATPIEPCPWPRTVPMRLSPLEDPGHQVLSCPRPTFVVNDSDPMNKHIVLEKGFLSWWVCGGGPGTGPCHSHPQLQPPPQRAGQGRVMVTLPRPC